MTGKLLAVVLMSVMAILPLTTEAHRSETEPGSLLARVSPVMFVENAGQWDDDARFQVWGGPNATIWLAEDAIWLSVLEPGQQETGRLGTIPEGQVDKMANSRIGLSPGDRELAAPGRGVYIKLSFINANPHPSIEAFGRLDTTVSYFYGNDTDKWRPDVPVWGGVRYNVFTLASTWN